MTDHDPSAPPPPRPDGTGAGGSSTSSGGSAPVSGQPWSTFSGDSLAPQPPAYSPGQASVPEPDYPPTSQFPPVNYAPPGQAPDYGAPPPPGYGTPAPGQAQQPGHSGYGAAPPSYGTQPPGYGSQPPSYGSQPPGYGPPPPGGYPPYQPPQPPPRRSNAPIIAVILAVTLLLCGGLATAGVLIARSVKDKADETIGSLPTSVPEVPGLPTDLPTTGVGQGRPVTVTYEVTGDGPVSIVYIEKIGQSPKRLENVKLPWKLTVQAEVPALLSVVVVRLDTSEGSVSCRALADGKEVKTSKSGTGNFASTSCVQLVLE